MSNSVRLATPSPDPQERLVNVEAEAALLGALMLDNKLIDRAADVLAPEHFGERLHGDIFAVIIREHALGRPVSPPTLRQFFIDHAVMTEVGGPAYLARLTGSGAALIIARELMDQIKGLAVRRRLFDRVLQLQGDIVDRIDQPIEELVGDLDAALSESLERKSSAGASTIAAAWDVAIKEIEDEAAGLVSKGVQIAGLDDWNQLTGGMRKGEVIVMGARPGMGKTATALAVGLGSARAGHGTLLVSLEMTRVELMKRAISDLIFDYGQSAGFEQVKQGKFTEFDRMRLREAREEVESWPMILTDPASMRIGKLAMSIRRYQRQMEAKGQTLELVVLDYLGLIKSDNSKASRYEGVGEVSRAIKEIAKQCGVAILLLAQLNREVEKRPDKRPILADLRDSGDIEQDADMVIFLYREEYYLQQSEPDLADKKRPEWELAMQAASNRLEIIAAKVRNGKTDRRKCWFFSANQAVRGSRFFQDNGR